MDEKSWIGRIALSHGLLDLVDRKNRSGHYRGELKCKFEVRKEAKAMHSGQEDGIDNSKVFYSRSHRTILIYLTYNDH